MDKLLIISGPTASGKTALALKLAKIYNGYLISADSRQIYKGMDIGTGKDHPKDIPIALIDIITPAQAFSVAEYRILALKAIAQAQSQNKLPIIVGGSGQYIDAIINPRPTYTIKPNPVLRFILNPLPLIILQKLYRLLDQKSYKLLNNSEVHNPHRLIRKIEISLFSKSPFFKGRCPKDRGVSSLGLGFDTLHLHLTAPNAFLFKKIDHRIQSRLDQGLLDEITNLLKNYSWSQPGLNTFAYKEFKPYFVETHCNTSLLNHCISRWHSDEHAYCRRQKTWFKKCPNLHKFDITKTGYIHKIEQFIEKWYNKP